MTVSLTLPRPAQGLVHQATRLWRAYPRESVALGLLGGIALFAGALSQVGPDSDGLASAPPTPPPMAIRKLAPAQAVAVNQAIPLATGPSPAAAPFASAGNLAARAQALECLTSAIYYEAGNEPADGQRAVAQVVLNRVRHPTFPSTVCGVVYQGSTRITGCQFTFTCDGSLARRPSADGWDRARRIATQALGGAVYAPAGWATHYHADYVVPYWASTLAKNAIVGAHIFYRWAGDWGQPAAFVSKYSGREPTASALRSAALMAEAASVAASPQGVAAVVEQIPGAEKLAPSMRGDKRVAVRFNLTARKASDEAPRQPYVQKFETSDNLRWALSGESAAASEPPLGKVAPPATAGGSANRAAHP